MEVTLNLNTAEDELPKIELSDAEVSTLLACDGLGFGGDYYKIKHKVFEFVNDGSFALTITAEKDHDVVM